MAKKAPPGQQAEAGHAEPFWKGRKAALCAGILFSAGMIVLGGWMLRSWLAPQPTVPVAERKEIGFLNLQEAVKAHKDYKRLQELRQECLALREEIAASIPLPIVKPPEVEAKPFDDSVWQKNAQNIIGRRAEIERKQKRAAEEYLEANEEVYMAQRDAIDAQYLNDITNLRLKLDNADVLGLDRELVAQLSEQMAQLQRERGEKQALLREQWDDAMEQYAQQAVAQDLDELRAQAASSKEQLEAEAVRRRSEAQSRDVLAMEARMESSERFQKTMQKRQELAEKQDEILSLEKHIFNDVAGKAAKLAILHHFTMVIANPAARLEPLIPWPNRVGPALERHSEVIVSGDGDMEDITEELVVELKR